MLSFVFCSVREDDSKGGRGGCSFLLCLYYVRYSKSESNVHTFVGQTRKRSINTFVPSICLTFQWRATFDFQKRRDFVFDWEVARHDIIGLQREYLILITIIVKQSFCFSRVQSLPVCP